MTPPLNLPWGPNAGHQAAPTDSAPASASELAGNRASALAGSSPGAAPNILDPAAAPGLVIDVLGTPAPQGSKRHVGNGVMIESSKKVKPWREAVKWAAFQACSQANGRNIEYAALTGPVAVNILFRFARPKFHFRTGANSHLLRDNAPSSPSGRPDLDKVLRSTLDALGEAGVFRDDSQVVAIAAIKVYADTSPPGAHITVTALA